MIHTPPLNPSARGFDISIVATSDLNVWGAAVPATSTPARFFRLRVTER